MELQSNYNRITIRGFTLIEVLIYTALTAVVGMLMTGILLSVSQVHIRESASTEVTGQLNFVTQTIGRLVRTASNIEIDAGVSTSTIKLRMQDSSKDPTCISLVGGVIKLTEGTGAASDLTNTRVVVNALNFKKFVQYPGHDTVSYDIQMTYNSQNPKAQVQRSLSSAIARVSAATFDSNLLPGNTTYEIGQTGSAWKNLYLSGVLNLGTSATDPTNSQNGSMYYNTASSTFRGYKAGAWANLDLWTASSTAIYYNTGNVGIGTADPSYKLDVSGTFRATATSTFSGNVGIGTTDPGAYKLKVAGTLYAATSTLAGALDMGSNKITSVADPISNQDAATKAYVLANAGTSIDEQIYSTTANGGMYNNKIPAMTPPLAYTEVCFKSGATSYDIHTVSESTAGGNCVSGDVGFIIEKNERAANFWELAKQTCLQNNMRLPEPFEWKLSCKNATAWSLSTMINNWEWASNFSLPLFNGSSGVGAAIFGYGGCHFATWYWVGNATGYEASGAFRCVR